MFMFLKVTLLGVVFAIVGIDCEDSEPKIIEMNGLPIKVEEERYVIEDFPIPTLRRGALDGIEELDRLWLSRCNITSIEPGAFQNLPNLFNLFIMYNNLSKIEVGVFNDLVSLTWLALTDNGIQHIASHAFDNMTKLAVIDIKNNQLQQWDIQWFAKTPSMKFFFLNENIFTEIPANAFGDLKRTGDIYYINFKDNPIKRIDDNAFKNFRTISTLSLTINNTDIFSGNFLNATHFEEVEIEVENVECLMDEEHFSRIFVADSTKLTGDAIGGNCKNRITTWATEHQKNVIMSRW